MEANTSTTPAQASTLAPTNEGKWQDWVEVRRRLDQIDSKLSRLSQFCQFGATTDMDYAMADAQMAGLREERQRLRNLALRIHERDE